MAKAFSILHRASALLVAVCLLVGMALPVYAAGDESLFFDAGSETIPGEASTAVAETSQNTTTSGLESVSPKVDTVNEADGTSPAEDGSAPSSDTQDQEETVLPDGAPNTDEEPTAEEEPLMLADNFSADDGAGEPATIADTGAASQGFIPATTTIYFEDDGRYDTYVTDNLGKKCTIRFYAQKVATNNKDVADLNKDMVDAGETTDSSGEKHRVFSVTLNSADYPEGGFYRVIFQYLVDGVWKEEINAFGNADYETGTSTHWTAIDQLAGKKFVRQGIDNHDNDGHYNRGSPYNADQWTRVEYYYKGMPLYFKNGSGAALNNVTAVFYKQETDGTVKPTTSLPIGTVGANQFYAQKILIPNNQSQFVKFTWDNGKSDLYNFSTDPYDVVEKFDLTKTNCFVYDGTNGSWKSAGSDLLTGGKTIYFDATLSSYSYAKDPDIHQSAMPGDSKTMYCFLTDSENNVTSKEMTFITQDADSPTSDRQLWSCEIPDGTYTAVQFSAVSETTTPAKDNKTKPYNTADIPPTLKDPCFFADDGDPTAYSQDTPVFRDGYWGEKDSRHDAESGKGSTVVDIDNSGKFTQQKGTKYITSTLYDYYTDYELNGLNRDKAPTVDNGSQRWFVTFEQFDRALSSAYEKSKNVKYPLYTGHFEPTSGALFATVAGGMNLCGWGNPNGNDDEKALYNTFMAVNNSTYDDEGKKIDNDYSRTFQGLVEGTTSANGLPLLRAKVSTEPALDDPHFNEDFLQGNNSFNTVLGKVYKDVSFPFTKDAVFKDSSKTDDPEANAKYWYYDSSKASLYLKQDKNDGKYYLESPTKKGNPITDDKSKNIDATGGQDGSHGFFPFNQTVSNVVASQYNYGFGAKLQFDFTLTEDGNVVVGKDGDGNDIKVPIKFFFSGDDDVWVYIDDKLVLDVGGAHGKASGLLEFGAGSTVTPYVSSNKNTDTKDPMVYTTNANNKTVYFNQNPIKFTKTTEQAIQLNSELTTHTLTMFYMERGMWDSNMAVAFNFPDSNELQVEKQVDLTNVNDDFKPLFQGQNLFTFTLQNLATHYGKKEITNDTPKPVEVGSAFSASSSDTDRTTMEKDVSPYDGYSEEDKAKTVKWYAQGYDKNSEYRHLRYGTMTLNPTLDISKTHDYLSFDVYAVGGDGDGVLSTNYLYLTLEDSSGNKMGCDVNGKKKSYLNTMLSGSVVMKNNEWVTVKLQLDKMPGYSDSGFDLNHIQKILIGDDYERTVYFRNFVFTAKPVVNTTVGFSVEQKDIPDYGSATSGTLKPASGAIFTSSVAGNGTQAVDTDGTFDLQDGETVTFTDQFRRGSYISLQEAENPALYSTRWEVYENGTLVDAANTSSSVNAASPLPLKGDGTKPADNRTETADNPTTGSSYTGSKPTNANTLVFRSYAAPEEEFPKLKVRFINTVKVGKLVIEKKQANDGSNLTGKKYKFTVTFSNVGGIGLGGAKGVEMTQDLAVGDTWEIPGIPIGTRFRVVETPAEGSSLQDVTCNAKDAKFDVDNGVRGTVTSETEQVTATFTNTAHQLMDITVEKKWLDTNGDPLTDNQSDTVWVKLERRHVNDTNGTWQVVPLTDAVELKYDYMSKTWTHTFKRLDMTDVSDSNTPKYEYRVLESASETGDWYGGTDGDVIVISGKRYKVLNTTRVTGDSTDKTLTLTNQLQDAKYKLVITKRDAQDDSIKLDDVEFKLEKLNDDNITFATIGTGVTGSEGAGTGELTFADLSPGKYRLTETKTAAGYTLLSEAIEFELTVNGECKRNSERYGAVSKDTSGVYNIALTIYNRKGFTLPHTGADAPSLWLLLGLPALTAVLLVLVFRYKRGDRRS